jgi:L-asparaginase II
MRVLQYRGEHIETAHPVRAVVVHLDASGPRTTWTSGAPTRSPWRSAGKPFQLLASIEAMEAARHSENTPFTARSLSDMDLAIGASSHSGQPGHTDVVASLLQRFGRNPSDLRCGAEPPAHTPSFHTLLRHGEPPGAIHNDCSGKHAMMLGACTARGWDLEYRPEAHPLQQAVREAVQRLSGEAPGSAVDGCGVPVWVLSIAGMARAWAELAAAMLDPDRDPLLARIGQAMAEHPWHVSGEGRVDLRLAEAATEPYVGKIGAQGVFCVALPRRRLGLALKVATGDDAAVAVAARHLIETAAPGAIAPDPGFPWHTVRNVVGDPVGRRILEAEST